MLKFTRLFVIALFAPALAHASVAFPEPVRASAPIQQGNPVPLSQAGLIQNVQGYSSNPFFQMGGPYNQRMPVPIFAQGAELTAGDCQSVSMYIVGGICAGRNNCTGLRVSDIRPAAMTQLAALPGHNFVTACAGFIDGAFSEYMSMQQTLRTAGFPTAFPMPTGAATGGTNQQLILRNPLEERIPSWQRNIDAREAELAAMHARNAPDTRLTPTQMPTTFNDLSFADRQRVLAEGYQQWQCDPVTGRNCAYVVPKIEKDEERYEREAREMRAMQQTMTSQAELEKSRLEFLKATNRCAWCRQDSTTCYTEYTAQAKTQNDAAKTAACAEVTRTNTPTQTILWQVKSSKECTWELDSSERITFTVEQCRQATQQQGAAGASGTGAGPAGPVGSAAPGSSNEPAVTPVGPVVDEAFRARNIMCGDKAIGQIVNEDGFKSTRVASKSAAFERIFNYLYYELECEGILSCNCDCSNWFRAHNPCRCNVKKDNITRDLTFNFSNIQCAGEGGSIVHSRGLVGAPEKAAGEVNDMASAVREAQRLGPILPR
ncbi:MAG: hypothetical protein FWE52_00470 [Alphaproteobacteria bacterium]|nr:hypothetical protein [Alphaproteobacteria bacterium]